MTTHDPRALVSIRDLERLGVDRHALARSAKHGTHERVRRGTYIASDNWRDLDANERYYLRCVAECQTKHSRPLLSHWSAAVVHGIPIVGGWPRTIHRLVERTSGGRSQGAMTAHPARLDSVETVEVDGLLVTSVARTIVDLAVSSPFLSAVTSADFAASRRRRNPVGLNEFVATLDAAKLAKGAVRARRVLDFSTSLADSPAESVSRVNMFVGGFVMPTLQRAYFDAQGFIGEVDFDWGDLNLIGEVDGRQKYLKDEYLRGRTPGQVVYEEKVREDRLRALPTTVARWDWHRAVDPIRLRAFLRAAGVPLRRTTGLHLR